MAKIGYDPELHFRAQLTISNNNFRLVFYPCVVRFSLSPSDAGIVEIAPIWLSEAKLGFQRLQLGSKEVARGI
jgi:hypothetical protein